MPHVVRNPFTPTFGRVPFALAGRTEYIDDVIGGLANQPGDPNRSTIFIGPRGSGKTVLLETISGIASEQGWVPVRTSAREGMVQKLLQRVRSNAGHLLQDPSPSSITSVQVGPVSVGRELAHDQKSWWVDFTHMVEQINARGTGLLVAIDEVNPHCEELIEFIDIYQDLVIDGYDIALLMAGLPSQVSALLLDESVSFIRRAFQRPLDTIPQFDVEEALLQTIEANGRSIEDDALARAARATNGFAFAIQLVGYYLWRQGDASRPFTVQDVDKSILRAQQEMERSVFIPTLRELTNREHEYLVAMAQDEGPSVTSEVARRMGISMTNASNVRRRLIERGVIAEVRMGQVEFTMPMLGDYLRQG